MKKFTLLFSFILLASVGIVLAQDTPQNDKLLFEKTTHDFGSLKEGDAAVYTFKFTNKSNKEISLINVKASCGCTTPSYTKDPVKPGATGEIQVSYATQGRPGPINKSVTVTYDTTEQPVYLFIRGDVVRPEPPAEQANPAPADGQNHDGHNHDGHNHGTSPQPQQPKIGSAGFEGKSFGTFTYNDLQMARSDVKFNRLAGLKAESLN
jgi:hypothetical protein